MIEKNPDKGLSFSFKLDAADPLLGKSDVKNMNNLNEEITVFIVDDNEEVRDSLKMLIESVGLIAETYGSAQSYLDKFGSLTCWLSYS